MKSDAIIRVLIVDDSSLARDMIRAILESDPGIVVVGEASNGREAIDAVSSLKPDVVTMDIEMPVMGGLEAIEKIIAENPVPVLVVTALSGVRTAFAAVSKGALDVVEKPDIENMETLIYKIRYLSKVDMTAHLKTMRNRPGTQAGTGSHRLNAAPKAGIIAIAASTGGPQAIHFVLSRLPASFPLPIVIGQHIAPGFTQGMVDWLNNGSRLNVVMAANGTRMIPGTVYVNPAEHSMRINESGIIALGSRAAGQIYNPSCDTLLASVAGAYGKASIGVIMTGMGDDGVSGMQAIREVGGMTLAQDAGSSVVYGMNRLAVERGFVQKVVPLAEFPDELMQRTGARP